MEPTSDTETPVTADTADPSQVFHQESTDPEVAVDPSVLAASEPFLGQWRVLVSTTNWKKGEIISAWRSALEAQGAPSAEYSDEAWSRLAGSVTPQHVGRLRRTFQRFGKIVPQFEGLYWSHFLAALDWDDAEMWLEGALQSGWSVSQMRTQRAETLGTLTADESHDAEIQATEPESAEEFADPTAEGTESADHSDKAAGTADPQSTVDSKAKNESPSPAESKATGATDSVKSDAEDVELVQPFAGLTELPDDVTDAFEAFKLAILRHKMDDWREVSRDDLLASLDALKALAVAPTP